MRCRAPDVDAHLAHFEALYAANGDPWHARAGRDEALKRRAIGYALGGTVLARGLEIGCGNGVSTRALARRFLRLAAVDGSAGAVALAKQEIGECSRVCVFQRTLPCVLPRQRFDAIVASEILYYLPRHELDVMLNAGYDALRRGGYFISTHHTRRFGDAECTHATLVEKTRKIFGHERRQLSGFGWRCYLHVR
ncbi:MAG: trans-aconitate 2-methyltransferase [Hyphomicrobiaceae bacterium]